MRTVWPIVKLRLVDCDLLLIVRVDSGGNCLDYHLLPSPQRYSFLGTLYGFRQNNASQYLIKGLSQLALLHL